MLNQIRRRPTERGIVVAIVTAQVVSLLVNLMLDDRQADIGINCVTDPDGVNVHDTTFEADSWDTTHFASEIVSERIVGTGELSSLLRASHVLTLPNIEAHVRMEFTEEDTAKAIVMAQLLPRSSAPIKYSLNGNQEDDRVCTQIKTWVRTDFVKICAKRPTTLNPENT